MTPRTDLGALMVIGLIGCSSGPRTTGMSLTTARPQPKATMSPPAHEGPAIDPTANDLPCCDILPTAEVASFEALVARGSTNCVDHARLAGHYAMQPGAWRYPAPGDALGPVRERHLARLVWLANHCPTKGQSSLLLLAGLWAPTLVERWEAQAKSHSGDPYAIANLAALIAQNDNTRAIALYERAEILDPRNPRWPEEQSKLLARGYFASVDDTVYTRAYTKLVRAAELTSATTRHRLDVDLAEAALRAGHLDKAKAHANNALARIGTTLDWWERGDLIYNANAILGRIALQAGDVTAAKNHLLEAAQTPGSPVLNSFGPDLTLANELLAKGERDVVIKFLDLIEDFWDGEEEQLAVWRAQIRRGETPTLRD